MSKISVVFVVKNAVKQGYCFGDSLRSSFPIADEIIISDGYSDDGTYEHLLNFKKRYGRKVPITILRDHWDDKSYHGEVIANISNKTIKLAKHEWVYYLQADEIIHEANADHIKHIAKSEEFNSVSFPFYHFIDKWEPANEGYGEAIRMIRNHRNSYLMGDAWNFTGDINPICPAGHCPKPIYHFAWVFPKQNDVKHIEHSKIYENIPEYQEKKIESLTNPSEEKAYPLTDFNDWPKLAKRFVGKPSYEIPYHFKIAIAINYVNYTGNREKQKLQKNAIDVLNTNKPDNVEFISINKFQERIKEPNEVRMIKCLKRDSTDIGNNRPLPYIKDVYDAIIDNIELEDNDVIGYINSDILLSKDFFRVFKDDGSVQAYLFSRHEIDHIENAEGFNKKEYQIISSDHPGYDGIFFTKRFWKRNKALFNSNLILGEPEWDFFYARIMENALKNGGLLNSRELYHVYHPTIWSLESIGAHNNRKINGTI